MLPACQVKDVFLYFVFVFFSYCIFHIVFFHLPQCCPLVKKRMYFCILYFWGLVYFFPFPRLWKKDVFLYFSYCISSLTPMLPTFQVKDVLLYLIFFGVIVFFHCSQVVKKRMHFCVVFLYFSYCIYSHSPQCCPLITKRMYFCILIFFVLGPGRPSAGWA